MGSKTNAHEDVVLNIIRNTAASAVTPFVGLFTAAPGETGGGTEVTGGSYARQSITFAAPSGGSVTQSGAVTFPQATANWGTVVSWGIFTASTAGTLLYWGDVTPNKAVNNGDTASFASGQIVVSED